MRNPFYTTSQQSSVLQLVIPSAHSVCTYHFQLAPFHSEDPDVFDVSDDTDTSLTRRLLRRSGGTRDKHVPRCSFAHLVKILRLHPFSSKVRVVLSMVLTQKSIVACLAIHASGFGSVSAPTSRRSQRFQRHDDHKDSRRDVLTLSTTFRFTPSVKTNVSTICQS